MTAAMQTVEWCKGNFSPRAFMLSLLAGVLFYGVLAVFIWLHADDTRIMQQEKLASQAVLIDWQNRPALPDQQGHDTSDPSSQEPPSPVDIAAPTDKKALPAAPIAGLFKDTDYGPLPVIRQKDNLTPFAAYRRPFDLAAATKPVIAIAVQDIGLSDTATQDAIKTLPAQTSFIFSPYAETIDFWAHEARGHGHEIWMSLPLEPKDFPATDLGPHTLMVNGSDEINLEKMHWVMSRTAGYAGLVATPNARFIESHNAVRPVISDIYRRGLAFIDSAADPGPVAASMALGMNAPYGNVNVWIDEVATKSAIQASFRRLEEIAQQRGRAAGIIRPQPVSYEQYLKWAENLEQRGYILAPLSAITGKNNE